MLGLGFLASGLQGPVFSLTFWTWCLRLLTGYWSWGRTLPPWPSNRRTLTPPAPQMLICGQISLAALVKPAPRPQAPNFAPRSCCYPKPETVNPEPQTLNPNPKPYNYPEHQTRNCRSSPRPWHLVDSCSSASWVEGLTWVLRFRTWARGSGLRV